MGPHTREPHTRYLLMPGAEVRRRWSNSNTTGGPERPVTSLWRADVAGTARLYPIRKVTTPVPVEGGVAGGALPMSAGTSFHGRRKPNGSACHRRTMAGVQEEAKHAIRAMSPLKSCDVEKPQPQRSMRHRIDL